MPPSGQGDSVNLSDLKQYVGNVVDYDPTANPTYSDQLGRIISDAYERIYTEKPWTFCQKEAEIEARPDVTGITIGVTNGSSAIATAGVLDSTMDGEIIELDGVEYIIAYVKDATVAYLTVDYLGATAAAAVAKVIFRYLTLPADCVTVMNVSHRSNSITPEDPGMMAALTRYEDEFYNLPLGETGVPRYWLPHDPLYIAPPSRPPVVAIRAVALKGERTIELAIAHEWGGNSSGLSPTLITTLTASEDVDWSVGTIPNETGYLRVIYLRFPNDGFKAWYKRSDLTGSPTSINPTGIGTLNLDTSTGVGAVNTDRLPFSSPRFQGDGGMRERVRLHPRQAENTVYTIRYMARPKPLIEETDTPDIPAAHRIIIAYKALESLLIKADSPAQSQLFAKRAEQEILKMERRYLITPARRIVKGNFNTAGSFRFNRFTRLTKVP